MALRAGSILNGRYRIESRLGRGGFGAVYRATDLNLGRFCALKENLDASPGAWRQFEREAKILGDLSHPHLPAVTASFTVPGQGQYLVMDYVRGQDLAERLARQGPLPEDLLLPWIRQIASALSYMHQQERPVIHRDVKPANIRLKRADSGVESAMLVDFGLAKYFDSEQRTTIGARAITPGYSPPEQYGRATTDARSDIYALGATLYHLLTGREPTESTMRLIRDNLLPARQVNPGVSLKTSQAIERAMALDPARRFQNMAAFIEALPEAVKPTGAGVPLWDPGQPIRQKAPIREVVEKPAKPAREETIDSGAGDASPPREARESHSVLIWSAIVVLVVLASLLTAALAINRWSPRGLVGLAASTVVSSATPANLVVAQSATPPPPSTTTASPAPSATATLPPTETSTPRPSPTPMPTRPAPATTISPPTATAGAARQEMMAAVSGLQAYPLLPGSPVSYSIGVGGNGERHFDFGYDDFYFVADYEELNHDEWLVGVILRYDLRVDSGDKSVPLVGLALTVDSDGEWILTMPDLVSQQGQVGFDLATADELKIEVAGVADRGWLFVNDRFVANLDFPSRPERGTLWLFAEVPEADPGQNIRLDLTLRTRPN